jgi:ApaG protein
MSEPCTPSSDVRSRFLPEQSLPEDGRFVFAYTIRINNVGQVPARLLSRHWLITDANGKVQEVRGEGVVGEQPWLRPGEHFEYTSGAVLETPLGTMRGSYRCWPTTARISTPTSRCSRSPSRGRCTDMATYAIGDVQGCLATRCSACWKRSASTRAVDRLWFCGRPRQPRWASRWKRCA